MTATFGKRVGGSLQAPDARRKLAGAPQLPQSLVQGSHLERHWPKYAAAAFACFAVAYGVLGSKGDPMTFAIVGAVGYFVAYRVLNGFRKSVDNVHKARTQLFRSVPFLVGACCGAAFYLFTTFVSPLSVLGFPLGGENPLANGFQQEDFAGLASLLIGLAAFMVAGGLAIEFVAKLFTGAGAGSRGSTGSP